MGENSLQIQGYYSGKDLETLRWMAAGHRMTNPIALNKFLKHLNETTPFFRPPIDLIAAWKRDMTGMIIPGSIGPWLKAQPGGTTMVVHRLHQTMIDIYQDSERDPDGMKRTGQLIAALDGSGSAKDDVQAMFVAMFKDLRKSDPVLADQLLVSARADYLQRITPSGEKKLPKVSEFVGHGLPAMVRLAHHQHIAA